MPINAEAETTLSQKFEDTRDQGIHYFKKKRFRQAYLLSEALRNEGWQ